MRFVIGLGLSILLFCVINQKLLAVNIKKSKNDTTYSEFYKRKYTTYRLKSTPPLIDGKLDDNCWNNEGEWLQNFVQQTPKEGALASERTIMKILYDDKYIYVAFRCYDSEPEKIQSYIGNRDQMLGDVVGVNFDSYFDHRTGYEFNVTAGGVQIDLLLKNDGNPDFNWNAVWYSATAINDSGWTAELKIPFSQLRYNNIENQVWGMHAWRWIARHSEEDQWSLIPRNNTGFIYSFGELHGIKNLPRSRRIETMPYILSRLRQAPIDKSNPFYKKNDYDASIGVDGKVGIGSDFTLDYTFNPDFGQVEADPSVMNLSAFETYFDEKRPFFLEGKNVLDFKVDNDILFYSRRIGHAPMVIPDADENNKKFVDAPSNTSIIDAIKLTGKTNNGLSVGILQSLTNKAYAKMDSAGNRSNVAADALTNYFLYRMQKDYNKGDFIIGGLITAVNRDINDMALDKLTKEAYSGGIDVMKYLWNRNFYISFNGLFSYITGSNQAMLDVQQSAVHYYQRPDANYIHIDSTARNLKGYGGKIQFGRSDKGKLRFSEYISWRSPGLELNDMGYQQRADFIQQHFDLRYVENTPNTILREYSIYFENEHTWNYGRQHESNTYLVSTYLHFINKWQFHGWIYRFQSGIDTRLLRGGPGVRMNPYWHVGMGMNTDWAKPITIGLKLTHGFDNISKSSDYEVEPQIFFRIGNRFRISNQFYYNVNNYDLMYVNTVDVPDSKRYIVGRLKQKNYRLTLRANYNISPYIAIQYYGSPFISQGSYNRFRHVIKPMESEYFNRFFYYTENNIAYSATDNKYTVNENNTTFSFDNPDFQMREFKSNFVFRWEYKPGSVFYFVWSHQRTNNNSPYFSAIKTSIKDMFDKNPDNVFMIKLNYYFNI